MNKFYFLILIVTLSLGFFVLPFEVEAQNDNYKLLAPLPCIGSDQNCRNIAETTTLEKYLPGIFYLLIGLSAVFAVLMIVIGGIQYMTTDALQGKEDGKARIWNSIKGLLLVISAWMILYTIDPNLLTLNFSLDPVAPSTPPAGTLGSPANSGSVINAVRQNCPSCSLNQNVTYNLDANSINRLNCSSCSPMDSRIPISSNNTNRNVIQDLNLSLIELNNQLNRQNVLWGVTEAYPPTVVHSDNCHYNGSCVDATLRSPTPENIRRFIETASNSGLRAQYEVKTEQDRQALIAGLRAAGMTGDLNAAVIVVPTINAPHFSVYRR